MQNCCLFEKKKALRFHLLLLGGSEAEVVEDLRFEHAQCLQQSWDEAGRVRPQTAAGRLTDFHQGLDAVHTRTHT